MKSSADAPSRKRLIVLLAAGLAVLLLAGIGVYGLIRGPGISPPDNAGKPEVSAPPASRPAPPTRIAPVAPSSDPETFARNVAEAVFSWDTGAGFMPLDYMSVLMEVADPTGAEQAGLANDLAAYFPTREAWVDLRQYATRQWLEITDAYTPDAWADAEAQARPGQLTEGTTAVTIEGVRHRAGVWNDEPVEAAYEVSFTVFVICEPAYDTCHLLRLSELDNPLR
ncbi:hypothetical protein [Brevibacterium luteolum]|uniref:hypothetical protein n=1 Tax=Brevibacterium luteolum TaxID=199591 RepID=UPI001C230C6E|nr:hypothetical protein [Brevibacterium luteolum]MBU8577606.1 hypothetical protein [Brevibacterium luteolum]